MMMNQFWYTNLDAISYGLRCLFNNNIVPTYYNRICSAFPSCSLFLNYLSWERNRDEGQVIRPVCIFFKCLSHILIDTDGNKYFSSRKTESNTYKKHNFSYKNDHLINAICMG